MSEQQNSQSQESQELQELEKLVVENHELKKEYEELKGKKGKLEEKKGKLEAEKNKEAELLIVGGLIGAGAIVTAAAAFSAVCAALDTTLDIAEICVEKVSNSFRKLRVVGIDEYEGAIQRYYYDDLEKDTNSCQRCDRWLEDIVRPVFDNHILDDEVKRVHGVEKVFRDSILMLKDNLGKYEYCFESYKYQDYIIEVYFKVLDEFLVK